jgi:hypothetical protein
MILMLLLLIVFHQMIQQKKLVNQLELHLNSLHHANQALLVLNNFLKKNEKKNSKIFFF